MRPRRDANKDEPFEGIDPIAAMTIRGLLAALRMKGVTVFMTSHMLEIVEGLAERVGVISAGRLVEEESLDALRASGRSLGELFSDAVGAETGVRYEIPWLD